MKRTRGVHVGAFGLSLLVTACADMAHSTRKDFIRVLSALLVVGMFMQSAPFSTALLAQQVPEAAASTAGEVRMRLRRADGSRVLGHVIEARPDAIVLVDINVERGRMASLAGRITLAPITVVGVEVLPDNATSSELGIAVIRHAVNTLGVGKKIDLMLSDQQLRATIESMEQESFTVKHGFRGASDQYAYADVQQVRPAGMHWGLKAALIGGVAFGADSWLCISELL